LVPDKVLYLRDRPSGEHIGDESPAMLGLEVFPLSKEGFIYLEATIKFMILVPFVLWVVYLIINGWSCKV
jgi:hypothetical protein